MFDDSRFVAAEQQHAQYDLDDHGAHPPTVLQRLIRLALHDRLIGRSRLRRSAIRVFRKECGHRPLDATLFGLRVRFHPEDNQTDAKSVVCGRSYNHRELGWLRRNLCAGDVFVDVGANMGFFSLYAASCGARVVAIEANHVLQNRLRTNFRFNRIEATLIRAAVGPTEGQAQLLPRDNDLGSGRAAAVDGGDIVMRPLHALLTDAGIDRIAMLKIDIEGGEVDALLPFFETAPASLHPRLILMERQTDPEAGNRIDRCLVGSGRYRVAASSHANILFERLHPFRHEHG